MTNATAATEVLVGLVERVTFHNPENGFCVLRIKARGHRDLVTVVGDPISRVCALIRDTIEFEQQRVEAACAKMRASFFSCAISMCWLTAARAGAL